MIDAIGIGLMLVGGAVLSLTGIGFWLMCAEPPPPGHEAARAADNR